MNNLQEPEQIFISSILPVRFLGLYHLTMEYGIVMISLNFLNKLYTFFNLKCVNNMKFI
jgi:hypothetical protein